jgi:hypothetical protein
MFPCDHSAISGQCSNVTLCTAVVINSTPCVSRLKSDRTAPQVSLNVRFTILNTKQTRLSALAFRRLPRNIVRSTVGKDAFIPSEDCRNCLQFVQANGVKQEPFETVLRGLGIRNREIWNIGGEVLTGERWILLVGK